VVEDGDVCIWESNAIVRYIAARYGQDVLWESDPVLRSESDRWMDWALGELQIAMRPAFWGLLREPDIADRSAIAQSVTGYRETDGYVGGTSIERPPIFQR
jgi:glutathione S-transferase